MSSSLIYKKAPSSVVFPLLSTELSFKLLLIRVEDDVVSEIDFRDMTSDDQ